MKTYSAKPEDIQRSWYIIDATDVVLGRLAAETASILRGKKNPKFSPNLDCGDHVVIINAEKIHLTGNKLEKKKYYWHTGYPGGIKERTAGKVISGEHPERVVKKAIERMISRNPLGRQQMRKLHVYAGTEHPHVGQQPKEIKFADANRKNKKS